MKKFNIIYTILIGAAIVFNAICMTDAYANKSIFWGLYLINTIIYSMLFVFAFVDSKKGK